MRMKWLLFGDIFKDHVDVDIEAFKGPNEFLVAFHYNPYLRPNAPIDQLWEAARRRNKSEV